MAELSSEQRVLRVLNRQEPDRAMLTTLKTFGAYPLKV